MLILGNAIAKLGRRKLLPSGGARPKIILPSVNSGWANVLFQ